MSRVGAAVLLCVLGALAAGRALAAAGSEKALPPDLQAVDGLFVELDAMLEGLERCSERKAAAALEALRERTLPEEPLARSTDTLPLDGRPSGPQEGRGGEAGLEAVAACRGSFAMDLGDKDLVRFFWTDSNDEVQTQYWACLALAKKDASVCDELKRAGFNNVARECRLTSAVLALVRAFASGDSQAGALCLDAEASLGQDIVSSPRACAALARGRDPAELCPAQAFQERYFRKPECVMALGLSGRREACSVFEPIWHGWERRACLDYAAYAKARAARDPGLCGEGPLCHALMAERASGCEAIAAMIRERFCLRLAPSQAPPPAVSTVAVTPASYRKLLETREKLADLAREQERVALDERRRTMREKLAAEAEAKRVEPVSRFNEISDSCLKASREIRERIDKAYAILTAFEPKGHPGHKSRVERLFELQSLQERRFKRLQEIQAP